MVNYQVTLRPVYSCPADEIPDGIKVPQGWRLSWHQVETWKALNDPDVAVIIENFGSETPSFYDGFTVKY